MGGGAAGRELGAVMTRRQMRSARRVGMRVCSAGGFSK